jgi:hypothetical protein
MQGLAYAYCRSLSLGWIQSPHPDICLRAVTFPCIGSKMVHYWGGWPPTSLLHCFKEEIFKKKKTPTNTSLFRLLNLWLKDKILIIDEQLFWSLEQVYFVENSLPQLKPPCLREEEPHFTFILQQLIVFHSVFGYVF